MAVGFISQHVLGHGACVSAGVAGYGQPVGPGREVDRVDASGKELHETEAAVIP